MDSCGTVDILFNNAGVVTSFTAQETPADEWLRVFNTDVTSAMKLSQLVAPVMKEKGKGAILFNSSISGFLARYNDLSYTVAKHALAGVTKTMAWEFAPEIRVNCIAPGAILTGITDRAGGPSVLDPILPVVALKRAGTPEEMASVALFLVSDEASYVVGQVIRADGGWEL